MIPILFSFAVKLELAIFVLRALETYTYGVYNTRY